MPSKRSPKPQYTPEQEKSLLVALMKKHGMPQMAAGGFMNKLGGALSAQSDFNAVQAPTTQVDYNATGQQGAQQAQQGYQQSQNLQAQQQELANQLKAQALGQGPNPAQMQLNQATGQNVANQAALMASQRGASANPGLVARQAAMQGAGIQQQAAGQAATLGAQQQLAAQQALQAQQQNQTQANLGEQGIQSGLFGTAGALTNTQNANNIQNLAQAQGINAQVAANNTQNQNKAANGALSGIASGLGGMFGFADGGEVAQIHTPNILNAPEAETQGPSQAMKTGNGLGSALGNYLKGPGAGGLTMPELGSSAGLGGVAPSLGVEGAGAGAAAPSLMGSAMELAPLAALAQGGKVPALVSPGERYLSPKAVKEVAEGKKAPMKAGEKIPGKAKVKGAKNSYDNDTVPKTLDEGGIVIPRSITQSKDPAKEASAFVSAILAKQGKHLPGKR